MNFHKDLLPQDLSQKIWEKLHPKSPTLKNQESRLEYLRYLNHFTNRQLIKYIFFLVFDEDDRIALEAGKIIEDKIKGIHAKELIEFDEAMRKGYDYVSYQLQDLEKLRRFPNPLPLLGICTFLPSGYLREKALLQLSQFRTGEELKFIFLRVNDWVPIIRKIAAKEILERLQYPFSPALMDCLDLIEYIYLWKRDCHLDISNAIEEAICHLKFRDFLYQALKHPDFHIRRFIVRLASKRHAIPFIELFNLISSDPDPMVRWFYVSNIKHLLNMTQLHLLTEQIKKDSFLKVRREALYLAIDNHLSNVHDLAEHALYDSHASMRELARWYLTKQGKTQNDFQNLYRSKLVSHPYEIGAISGIGEVGNEEDACSLLSLLNHPRAKIRKAAFIAISSLHPDLLKSVALNKLEHETQSMALLISKFLGQHPELYEISDLWKKFQTTLEIPVKLRILKVIDLMPKWGKFLYLLKASQEKSPEILTDVEKRLKRWIIAFNRSLISPNSQEIAQIKEALDKSALNEKSIESWKKLFQMSIS